MDKYIGDILDECGRDTRNDGYTGISRSDALRYANYAQQMLQSKIAKKYPRVFLVSQKQAIAANTPSYTINDNLYLDTRIHVVRYYPSATDDRTFVRLTPISPYMRELPRSGVPRHYVRMNGLIYVYPYPESANGRLEFVFERALDKLDERRAQVNGTPSGAILDLTSSVFGAPSTANEALFVKNQYVSVVDAFGNVMMRNGLISSYSAGNDELTLAANVSTYLVGSYTLANLADGYLTVGKWTTTHSGLVNECERFLAEYLNRRLFKRDSSNDARDVDLEMAEILQDILDAYKMPDMDAKPMPIIDNEILIYSYSELEP